MAAGKCFLFLVLITLSIRIEGKINQRTKDGAIIKSPEFLGAKTVMELTYAVPDNEFCVSDLLGLVDESRCSVSGSGEGNVSFSSIGLLQQQISEQNLEIQKFNKLLQNVTQLLQKVSHDLEKASKTVEEKTIPENVSARPGDCFDALRNDGFAKSGIYRIYVGRTATKPVEVLCDLDTNGGGWTVFLLRNKSSNSVNFYRSWEDYKNGFGDPKTEYWLGNENLHRMTSSRKYEMRLEAIGVEGKEVWGEWPSFRVDSEVNKYKLFLGKSKPGSAAQVLTLDYHNNMFFSTYDRDNDQGKQLHCAMIHKSGWWHGGCYCTNPTGVHNASNTDQLNLVPCGSSTEKTIVATYLQMKIRP